MSDETHRLYRHVIGTPEYDPDSPEGDDAEFMIVVRIRQGDTIVVKRREGDEISTHMEQA
ncbi:hypothetical protein PP304_gp170 [Gordonia phage Phendrix]|uniref:Uncharacterized protein n=1 Tax=Gordonia phage Phendrix TaxID=2593335 RepID=A0A514U1A2_9CAUD|nr:hypothetical protein PP304_gp170 [Gordonia phage Phendrix]QDK02699.1 hypothetical protein SEA_PHENDRIX_183 [Gordonia phage Phendrix]